MDSIYNLYLYLFIFGVLFMLSLLFGQRGMCHYFCPMSDIAGSKIKNFFRWPSLHLRAETDAASTASNAIRPAP